ncbi:MAG: hypothetical protein RMJ84_04070 [Sandaracinaceae bacterium]|nr:hypothetical protein [Sandaracinaceae bacterium]
MNPFIGTGNEVPQEPGAAEREAEATFEDHRPALPSKAEKSEELTGFDMRLVRVQPGVHLGTEQLCRISATGRLEPIAASESDRYGERASHRMSVRCIAPTGESWADLTFSSTNASQAASVMPGAIIRVRIRSADGGFFGYPIVEFLRIELQAPSDQLPPIPENRTPSPPLSFGFDLRRLHNDPSLVGSTQTCAVSHVGDIEVLSARESRRPSYPSGAQNRMTIRCRHAQGEEWADLVIMPSEALAALNIERGDLIRVLIVARGGGLFDYPVLQFLGN